MNTNKRSGGVIGVVQNDGRILTATIEARNAGDVLANHYATRLQATMIVSLGAIATLGTTPAASVVGVHREPLLVEAADFERMDACDYHLFARDEWSSWSIETVAGMDVTIET